jgi:uncharacterized protein YbbK (DUF523 family)/uncharacterized protein YbgA (DUF1722 family)
MHSPDAGDIVHIRPLLAVSSCLLGQAVRYDGQHKRHDWLVDTLGRCVDFRPLCPEVAIGLGIPREPVRLTGDPKQPRVRAVDNPDRDVTDSLQAQGRYVAGSLGDVAGYVFKSRSPSCGLNRVSVRTATGKVVSSGRGVYARIIQEAHPYLPVEEDSRLDDAAGRENFVSRLYTYRRWLSLCAAGVTARGLLDFHARHKYLLMAHSPAACGRLGRLLSHRQDDTDPVVLARDYLAGLMPALTRGGGVARHCNVLQHILGCLNGRLASPERAELLALIAAYRSGEIPLAIPLGYLREQFRRSPDECIDMQWYLWPYPDVLGTSRT